VSAPTSTPTARARAKNPPAPLANFLAATRRGTVGAYDYVELLGLSVSDPSKLLRSAEAGLSIKALDSFRLSFSLSLAQLSDIVQISPTTLARRRRARRLTAEESDRLLRMTRLFAKALELFEGDAPGARSWLSSPQIAFAGATPLDVARTEFGAREVEALLERLEYGVFS